MLHPDFSQNIHSLVFSTWRKEFENYITQFHITDGHALILLKNDSSNRVIPKEYQSAIVFSHSWVDAVETLQGLFPGKTLNYAPLIQAIIGPDFYILPAGESYFKHKTYHLSKVMYALGLLKEHYEDEKKPLMEKEALHRSFLHLYQRSKLEDEAIRDWENFDLKVYKGRYRNDAEPVNEYINFIKKKIGELVNIAGISSQDKVNNTGELLMSTYPDLYPTTPNSSISTSQRESYATKTRPIKNPKFREPRKVSFYTEGAKRDEQEFDTDEETRLLNEMNFNINETRKASPNSNEQKRKCDLCSKNHSTWQCSKLQLMRQQNAPPHICKKCLRSNKSHNVKECDGTITTSRQGKISLLCARHHKTHFKICTEPLTKEEQAKWKKPFKLCWELTEYKKQLSEQRKKKSEKTYFVTLDPNMGSSDEGEETITQECYHTSEINMPSEEKIFPKSSLKHHDEEWYPDYKVSKSKPLYRNPEMLKTNIKLSEDNGWSTHTSNKEEMLPQEPAPILGITGVAYLAIIVYDSKPEFSYINTHGFTEFS